MTTSLTTVELDPERDWSFYHERAPVPQADRARIRRLGNATSEAVWDAVVGQGIATTVGVRGGWLSELSRVGEAFEWHRPWNTADDGWAASVLRPRLGWPGDAPVLFLCGPTWSLTTTFDVFVCYWRAFLFEDEGPLLVTMQRSEVAWFWPSGSGRLGRRPMSG